MRKPRSDVVVGGYRTRDGFTKEVRFEPGLRDNVDALFIRRWPSRQRQIGA